MLETVPSIQGVVSAFQTESPVPSWEVYVSGFLVRARCSWLVLELRS